MTDVHTKEQRSRNMAAIRGRRNKSTELVFVKILRDTGITGWRRHYKSLPGTPDFLFRKQKTIVFVDGCFWHGCTKCKLIPATNTRFWKQKIAQNKLRDKSTDKELRKRGWQIVRIWEHELKRKSDQKRIKQLLEYLKKNN